MTYVYYISDGTHIKIGIADDPEKRRSDLQVANSHPLKLLFSIPFESRKRAAFYEKVIHRGFSKQRLRGEWFAISEDQAWKFSTSAVLEFTSVVPRIHEIIRNRKLANQVVRLVHVWLQFFEVVPANWRNGTHQKSPPL